MVPIGPMPFSHYSSYFWDGWGCLLLMIVSTHQWMNSLGTHAYGSSHVEQSRIAWKRLGNLQAPALTLYHCLPNTSRFYNRTPSSAQYLYSPPHPSLKSGAHLIKGWHWDVIEVAFAKVIQRVCVPPSLLCERIPPHYIWIPPQRRHGPFLYFSLKCSMQSRGHLMTLPRCLSAVLGKARFAAADAAAWF